MRNDAEQEILTESLHCALMVPSDFYSCVLWLDHSIGTSHRPRASQITLASALSFIHSFIHGKPSSRSRPALHTYLMTHSGRERDDNKLFVMYCAALRCCVLTAVANVVNTAAEPYPFCTVHSASVGYDTNLIPPTLHPCTEATDPLVSGRVCKRDSKPVTVPLLHLGKGHTVTASATENTSIP